MTAFVLRCIFCMYYETIKFWLLAIFVSYSALWVFFESHTQDQQAIQAQYQSAKGNHEPNIEECKQTTSFIKRLTLASTSGLVENMRNKTRELQTDCDLLSILHLAAPHLHSPTSRNQLPWWIFFPPLHHPITMW